MKLKPSLHSLKPAGSFGNSFVLQLLCGPKQITFLLYFNSSSPDEGNRRLCCGVGATVVGVFDLSQKSLPLLASVSFYSFLAKIG